MIEKKQTWLVLLAFIFFANTHLFAQEKKFAIPKYLLVNLSFSFQNPGADLDQRYGWNNTAGVGLEYLSSKNFIFGVHGDFLFGNRVREDVLASLRNSDGQIVGNNRAISNIKLTQRGWNLNAHIGKLIPFTKKNPRSGIRITAGAGFLQHKIRIQQDPQSLVPQASGIYRKGYDRLSNGLALTEFIGYQKVSPDKKINFSIGVEFVQGFTQNRRDWNFDQRQEDDNKYFDTLIGGKLIWTIPFEVGGNPDEIFY